MSNNNEIILEVKDLKVYYRSIYGLYRVVDGVSFDLKKGEILSIAGESGSGKSTMIEGILRLIKPPGFIAGGSAYYRGIDLLKLPEDELRKIRWHKISYIPQGSMNSLNPVLNIHEQFIDAILDHTTMSVEEATKLALDSVTALGLPPFVLKMYPHQLSGGMKQRVIIAMAFALKPEIIVADEPVTALDVVMVRSVLEIFKELRRKYNITLMVVSHDMSVHAELGDRMVILYAGQVVETGSITDIYNEPLHPYTKLLLASIPRLGVKELKGIPGIAPSPLNWPPGCRFHPRCPYAMDICRREEPPEVEIKPGRRVKCWLYAEGKVSKP
ncbi:ABC transporter ATP-binding protein [Caldivirga sp.]|uniref:ABC transporter ATP-binding protein n=1 Tax=Caldivirga sp. TaxID=2080243 RepID=UPI003D0B9960